ncbi:sensor domain-containing protein [Rhodococcus tibetensis]|uniref:Sensor domain-containing protein n=1 Tax=Rhodococcus tibetensis TaxID=2965064 RepID=A0ABT1Q9Z0_9NOCA|nr:sensor domain-containing protein [Rhodococcus sp. FXJ9.536]MCQ4119063.1 sensor domain-containing protein [Rhodococcus sp. FXJ9.536]
MRRSTTAAVLTALAVSACSSTADGESGPDEFLGPLGPIVTASPGASGAPFIDQAALRAALLDVRDLPVGFAPVADPEKDLGLPPASETAESDKSSTDPALCGAVLSPVADQHPGAASSASAWFQGPDFTTIDQDAASYATAAEAAQAFTDIQTTLAQCSDYSGTDADGVDVQYRAGGRDGHPAGDASVGFRLVTTSDGFSLVSDVAVAVAGSTVTQLVATGQEPIDEGVFEKMTQAAASKLAPAPAG